VQNVVWKGELKQGSNRLLHDMNAVIINKYGC
jgi:hypothetical protein